MEIVSLGVISCQYLLFPGHTFKCSQNELYSLEPPNTISNPAPDTAGSADNCRGGRYRTTDLLLRGRGLREGDKQDRAGCF